MANRTAGPDERVGPLLTTLLPPQAICRPNNLNDANLLRVGQKLTIPTAD